VSSKRDLVEAHAFSRRRLVTAFVSGAPGGREVEPVRPGRAVIGGVAVSVLLVAGAAVAGVIAPRTPSDWLQPGVIIAKESGADYVVVEDGEPLRPLINTTSAQLIFGRPELDPSTVSREEINEQELGDTIGIFGAPDSLPTENQLVGTGWTACANNSGGLHLRIDGTPGAREVPGGAVVVPTLGGEFLVAGSGAGAHRLLLPDDKARRADLLNDFGNPTTVDSGGAWLNLFALGAPLAESSFPVRRSGRPASYAPRLGSVGDLVRTDNGRTYLLGDDAPVELGPFALAVYRWVVRRGEPRAVDSLGVEARGGFPTWPIALPRRLGGEACAVLDAAEGRAARTGLATGPTPSAAAAGLDGAARGSVAPSLGAYVLTAGHGDNGGGQPWVIDSQGTRYRLGGPAGETAEALGYASYAVPTIPDAWVELFDCGPELSRAAAVSEPDPSGVNACDG
jgi:type VII secretion protein EccB